jgi:hypothetical protein
VGRGESDSRESAQRVLKVADQILKAGAATPAQVGDEALSWSHASDSSDRLPSSLDRSTSGIGTRPGSAGGGGSISRSRLRFHLARTFVDAGTSGKLGIEDPPVLLEAVAALRRGDVLLVAKRDRIGRDVIAVAMIERLVAKRGARVISAAGEGTESDDPAGLLMRRSTRSPSTNA